MLNKILFRLTIEYSYVKNQLKILFHSLEMQDNYINNCNTSNKIKRYINGRAITYRYTSMYVSNVEIEKIREDSD